MLAVVSCAEGFHFVSLSASLSVSGQIHLRAGQPGGVTRAILDRGLVRDEPRCWEIRSGIETEIDCDEIRTA